MTTTNVLILLFLCTVVFCCLCYVLLETRTPDHDDRWLP